VLSMLSLFIGSLPVPALRTARYASQTLSPHTHGSPGSFLQSMAFSVSPLDLHDFCRDGSTPSPSQMIERARILSGDLPLRFAQQAAELSNFPYGLSSKSTIKMVSSRRSKRAWNAPSRVKWRLVVVFCAMIVSGISNFEALLWLR
jgi:Mitochondrial branched-chain alpha-ketoacid dehydrogenase kinase